MSLHPWAESSIAAAESDLDKALASLRLAARAEGGDIWGHIGRAMSRVEMAMGELQDARRIEDMAKAAGGEGS